MNFESFLDLVQGSAVAHAISKSNHMVGAVLQIVHILGFVLLLASLVLVSLRLLGKALPEEPLERIAHEARRFSWLGLGLAVSSGLLMLIATPRLYVGNWAFQLKVVLFIAASLVQIAWFRRIVAAPAPRRLNLRLSVATTLILWFSVGLAGRLIGFV